MFPIVTIVKIWNIYILYFLYVSVNGLIIKPNLFHRNLIHPIESNPYMRLYATIIAISDQNSFDEITIRNSDKIPVVIDFQKSNCRPCQKIAPLFNQLASKYDNKAKFYKVDADSSRECLLILKGNNVKAVPTFQVWIAGKQIDIIQGAKLDELDEAIQDAVLSSSKS